MVERARVVIVGGGFGGLNAALALARASVEITLLDRHNYHLFQPLLYQVATAGLFGGNIAYPIRWILRGQRNITVLMAQVVGVSCTDRLVHTSDGSLPYDFLILAPGSETSYFGHDDWQLSAPGLKDLDDAFEVRRRVLFAFERAERATDELTRRQLLTFVIVGGGPTGVELAGALAEMARHVLSGNFRRIEPAQARIVLVDGAPRILSSFPAALAAKARSDLERRRVEIRTGQEVKGFTDQGLLIGDELLVAGTVLWAAGVRPSRLGQTLGVPLDRSGRVVVAPDLSVPAYPEVFVVGDLAAFPGPDGGTLPGLAPVAIQEGRAAAANVIASLNRAPRARFQYVDRGTMATVGKASAIADLRGHQLSGLLAWLAWLLVHIIWLIGFRNRLLVLLQWSWAYLFHDLGARLITGREPATRSAKDEPQGVASRGDCPAETLPEIDSN